MKKEKGITLVALIITIIIMLILVAVSVNTVINSNIIGTADKAKAATIIADEKEKVELAYVSAAINKLGGEVEAADLQDELDFTAGQGKTFVSINGDETLNVLFYETEHNFNVNKGKVAKVDATNENNKTMAVFDTGTNVAIKMHTLAKDGEINNGAISINLSIDKIKRYQDTPDLTKMSDENIVSWVDAYKAYEQNPEAYRSMIPEGYTLCPIYMWFEENEGTKTRNSFGASEKSGAIDDYEVKTRNNILVERSQ